MTEEIPGPELKEAALTYAKGGWYVFPCAARGKMPYRKDGFFEHGCKDASKSPWSVKAFWGEWPQANIGLACGEETGVWVVDADVKAPTDDQPGYDGFDTMRQLQELFGEALPPTLGQKTPSGGYHWLFRWPGKKVPNSAKKRLGPGLDVRGDGGYILVAPSVHPNGGRYAWDGDPASTPIARAPEWLLRLLFVEPSDQEGLDWLQHAVEGKELPDWLAKRIGIALPKAAGKRAAAPKVERVSPYVRKALEDECLKVRAAPPGCRNQTLNEAAFSMGRFVGAGALERAVAELHLRAAMLSWDGVEPAKRARDEKTLQSALDSGALQPREVPEQQERRSLARPRTIRPGGPPPARVDLSALIGQARAIWQPRHPLDGTPAAAYLTAQGIAPAQSGPWLGFVPALDRLWSVDGDEPVCVGTAPALIAGLARWPDRSDRPEVVAVLAYWLREDGALQLFRDPATGRELPGRALIGAWHGAAVRLGRGAPGASTMLVATGLVEGLRARLATPELPVWVAGTIAAMERLSLPEAIREVILLGAGRADPAAIARIGAALGHGRGRIVKRVIRARDKAVA